MINLAAIIAGAVNGAIQQVIPPVARDVVQTIAKAQEASPMAPAVQPPPALDAEAIAARVIEKVLAQPQLAKVTTPLPWYRSEAIWGGILATAAPVLGLLGYALSPDDMGEASTALASIAGGIGGAIAIYGRLTTTRQIQRG